MGVREFVCVCIEVCLCVEVSVCLFVYVLSCVAVCVCVCVLNWVCLCDGPCKKFNAWAYRCTSQSQSQSLGTILCMWMGKLNNSQTLIHARHKMSDLARRGCLEKRSQHPRVNLSCGHEGLDINKAALTGRKNYMLCITGAFRHRESIASGLTSIGMCRWTVCVCEHVVCVRCGWGCVCVGISVPVPARTHHCTAQTPHCH